MENVTANKRAYELGGIAIGFLGIPNLGDAIINKKVIEALAILEPNCNIDIICEHARSKIYAKAFYSDMKNFNSIVEVTPNFNQELPKYDLVLYVQCFDIKIFYVNVERLSKLSPALFQSMRQVDIYNKRYMNGKDFGSKALFLMARSRILKTNRYTSLACGGALPIYDNKVTINLLPEWQGEFEKLGLKKYITIGSNGGKFGRHGVKSWPTRYWVEFISLLKSKMPEITVVQSGGNGVEKFENADRHLLGTDLELTKYILKNSLLHVDIEGGPVHLASQLGTKCVVLFGAIEVDFLKYTQNINIVSEVCSPCYFAWDTDSQCLLGGKEPLCMLSITPQKVFDVTYRYLRSLE